MTTTTNYDAAVHEIAPDLEYRAEFVPQSKSRSAAEKTPSLNWRVTFSRNGRELTTDYRQGIGHLPHYSHAFAKIVVYDNAVREAAETGKSRLREHKNAYDACQADHSHRPGNPIPAPGMAEVLHCLLMDAEAINAGSFEEWASDLGYDTGSRKAEGIYRECLDTALKLRAMLGDETISRLRDALQDM